MKRLSRTTIIIAITIGFTLFGTGLADAHDSGGKTGALFAWGGGSGAYSVIRFTGAFFEPGNRPENASALRTLEVLVEGKNPRLFVVEKARNLSRVETELQILKSIPPRRLTLWGAQDTIRCLEDPGLMGQPLIVQGHLYRSSGRFRILFVESPEENNASS